MTSPAVRVDTHTHIWSDTHLSSSFKRDLDRIRPNGSLIDASPEAHYGSLSVEQTVVVAFDAAHSGLVVPDEFVSAYVAKDPRRLIGYCSVNPLTREPRDAVKRATEDLGLRGVKLAPTYQAFDPLCSEAFALYEAIAERGLPVLWHQGAAFVQQSVLNFARPAAIDDVARRFPEIPIVIAHVGSPWVDECLAVVRKHPQVHADISGIVARPSLMRQVLVAAAELGCADRLIFGTDWPFSTIDETAGALLACAADTELQPHARAAALALISRDPLESLRLNAKEST